MSAKKTAQPRAEIKVESGKRFLSKGTAYRWDSSEFNAGGKVGIGAFAVPVFRVKDDGQIAWLYEPKLFVSLSDVDAPRRAESGEAWQPGDEYSGSSPRCCVCGKDLEGQPGFEIGVVDCAGCGAEVYVGLLDHGEFHSCVSAEGDQPWQPWQSQ